MLFISMLSYVQSQIYQLIIAITYVPNENITYLTTETQTPLTAANMWAVHLYYIHEVFVSFCHFLFLASYSLFAWCIRRAVHNNIIDFWPALFYAGIKS